MVDHVCKGRHHHGGHGRGPSSLRMHDPDLVFSSLDLKEGDCFLDLGCGPGDYSIRASHEVGGSGRVLSLEREGQFLRIAQEKAISENRSNIKVMKADITQPLLLESGSVDVCLLATVMHIPMVRKAGSALFREIHRVLRPGGRFAVIECKKEEQKFGPPIHLRLSPQEVEETVLEHGFEKSDLVDLGYNYLIQFKVLKAAGD